MGVYVFAVKEHGDTELVSNSDVPETIYLTCLC
jgi:hypothetical protein